MAKSKSFFGLRKGSTKSHTYSVLDGQQVTKDRVYDVKNPRTLAQMRQRMVMTTVGAAYKYLKAIADHSFEGKASGMQCMRAFNSANLNRFKSAAALNGATPFNEYKDGAINPLPFKLSEGSLPGFDFQFGADNKLAIQFASENADVVTAEGIYALMGVQKNDLITFCSVVGESSISNGVFDYKPASFDIVRLRCDKNGAITNLIDAFTISSSSASAAVEFATIDNGITIKSGVADFGAVILSRKTDNAWLRSTTYMIVRDAVVAGALSENQLATYPTGTDLILNNGPMQNEENSGDSSLPKPNLAFAQSTINANGSAKVAAPKLTGVPSGASVQYKSSNIGVAEVNAATGEITPISNGNATITATTSATDEYASGTAKFDVVVSGIVADPLTITPSSWSKKGSEGQTVTQTFTFANEEQNAVIVNVGDTKLTSSVASDKKSVTLSGNMSSIDDGTVTIKVGSKQGEIKCTFEIELG